MTCRCGENYCECLSGKCRCMPKWCCECDDRANALEAIERARNTFICTGGKLVTLGERCPHCGAKLNERCRL
jgi:hypothetical protein